MCDLLEQTLNEVSHTNNLITNVGYRLLRLKGTKITYQHIGENYVECPSRFVLRTLISNVILNDVFLFVYYIVIYNDADDNVLYFIHANKEVLKKALVTVNSD